MVRIRQSQRLVAGSLVLMAALALPFRMSAQLIPLSSITGGSSVFVFRNIAKSARRFVAQVKPVRAKAQRLVTVAKIRRQYETIAKVTPRTNRAASVDPLKVPKNVRTLPAAEGSKIFAGVGEFYNDKGDFEKAIEFFIDAIDLDPANKLAKNGYAEALAIKGNDLLVKDQAAAAKAVFLEALKNDPDNVAALFGLGEVYSDLGQTADAIASYERSLQTNKDLTEIYVPLGILYYQSGAIDKADEMLTRALAFSAESAETQFFLGLVRSAQGKNEEALAAFQKAKTLDQTLADAFYQAGEMLVRLKRTADAIPELTKATEIKPTMFDAWFALGEAYLELGNHPEAIKAYKAAARLKNNDWEVFAGLGDAYRQTNDFQQAEANYGLAATFLGASKEANSETLANLHSKIGLSIGQQCDVNAQRNIICSWAGAIRALKKAAELTDNPIDHVNLGWAYFRVGHQDFEAKNMAAAKPNLDLAVEASQKALAAGPPASDFALQNIAAAQIDLGDYKNAIDTLNRLTTSKPDLVFPKYALGVAYNKSGDLANAEKWLRTAADAEPTNVGYLVGLADTLIGRKNGKELQKVIDRIKPLDAGIAANLEQRKKLLRL